ncbi:MAG: TonB-dependent receptor [Planctomycetes bacterium]|nr:TonB-dependent receptor [Planctomycetota bacterium]
MILARSPLVPCVLAAWLAPALAQEPVGPSSEPPLAELSLEDLMEIEISVASRHGERLMDVPAAVYVLTGDELRRQGVQTIQDALRMVPGFHVAQWRSQGWDVASRGFTGGLSELNQSFMNQLLLMVDGVSLYSPAMAGIWWPLLDIPIQDVERIEIIRGPAGTLWGTNAMNGVVHVITKHARDTQGARLDLVGGTTIASGDAAYGGTLGENGWFRTWASSTRHDGLRNDRDADWHITSVGWRSDWDLGGTKRARILGTIYGAEFGPTYSWEDDAPKAGGFLSALYEFGATSDQQRIQAWFWLDHQVLPDLDTANFSQDLQTLDLEWTRRRQIGAGSSLSFGLGGRVVQADMGSEQGYIDFDPEFQRIWSVRGFAQGEFEFQSLDSKLVAGLQVEESDVHDLELQPNVRWLWRAKESTNVWASVSRAVRTSSIEERDIVQRFTPGDTPFFVGDEDYDSEELLAYEIGLRTRLSDALTADLTAFYNDYDNLQTFEDLDGVTLTYGNEGRAIARGFEAAVDANLTQRLRLRGTYTYFEMDFEASDSSLLAGTIDARDGLVPVHHASLRTFYDLGSHWEVDGAIYYVDRLPYFDVDSYVRVDLRLGWNPRPGLRFAIGVQNLNDPEHPEAGDIEVERVLWAGFSAAF